MRLAVGEDLGQLLEDFGDGDRLGHRLDPEESLELDTGDEGRAAEPHCPQLSPG